MHRLLARTPTEPPALHQWREHALQLMLRLILVAPLPIILLDAWRLLPQGAYLPFVIELLTYTVAVAVLLNRRIPYQWRAVYLLSSNLLFATYLLMNTGLVGAGRVYLVTDIVVAALLLSRPAALLVWLCAAAALTFSGLLFAGQPPDTVAPLAQRLTDPNTLLTNGLITLVMGVIAALGAAALIRRLTNSLLTTEEALAERDQANAELERRVTERTGELAQTLTALQASEAKYKTLFQALPVGVLVVDDHGQYIEHNQIARDLLTLDVATGSVRGATELIPRLIRPDGSPLPLSDYPSVWVAQHRQPITNMEMGIVHDDHPNRTLWVSTNVAPLDLPGYGAVIAFSDITAYKRMQVKFGLQLRYAEALARCSQILLRQIEGDDERQASLEAVLAILRETVDVSRLYIFQPPTDQADKVVLRIVVESHDLGLPTYIEPAPEEIADAPREMLEALFAGRYFGGPVLGQFPNNPHFQQSLDQNGVQAILMVPIILGGSLWGVLSASDHIRQRDWDAPTVQFLRIAAEMLATSQQAWETTQALRKREHFIKRVTEATPDTIHVIDLATHRSLFVNRSIASLVGYAPDQVAVFDPETVRLLVRPDDYDRVITHYAQMADVADGQLSQLTYRARMSDGRERWVLSRELIFARDATGQPSQLLSITQDITESKQTELALAASEARLRALRDALPDLLFILRADGVFIEAFAPRQQELLMPPEQFLGRHIDEVMPPHVATMAHRAIARVRATGAIELFEYPLAFGENEQMFEARLVAITDDDLLVVVRDVTERRRAIKELLRAKEAAEAADRAKSTFLAHVSHEIRTPLTAIIGVADLLRYTDLTPSQHEYVTTMRAGAETLRLIIGNILDFSKIEAGHMELNAQPLDPRACMYGACDLIAHSAEQKGLIVVCAIDSEVPASLVGDDGRLRQVLVNLLGNAVKFTEHGTITLSAGGCLRPDACYELVVTIRDSGIGIAAEYLAQIFEPFVQGDSATTRRFGGTGLGLTISRQLVTLMGGQLTVVSTVGKGSTFTLTLPLPVAETPLEEAPSDPQQAGGAIPGALRLLLAEDNPINQEVLRRLLESLGYAPDVVSNGAEALAAVRSQPYDVVLMDIQMPELDGEAATRGIRLLDGITQPYIIALTASALRGDRDRYLAAGMDAYLSKPVQLEELRAALIRPARRAGRTSPRITIQPEREPAPVVGALAQSLQALNPARESGLVDWVMLNQLLASIGGTPSDAVMMVCELFRGTLSVQIEEIAVAVANDDRPRVRLLAHKLGGGARQLSAIRLAENCAALEEALQLADAPLAAILALIRRTYGQTLTLLTERLASVSDGAGSSL